MLGEGVGGGGGGELVVLWMLSDRVRLEEGALILLVCVQVVDVHTDAHTCLKKKEEKRKKTALRAVSKQAIGQNYYLAQKWCSTILR